MLYATDTELMNAFRSGSQLAFKVVYDRLALSLLYFADNMVSVRVEAEDQVAAAFAKLYNARQRMETYEHIKRWMYVIVRNQCIDALRERSKKRKCDNESGYLNVPTELELDMEMLKIAILEELLQGVAGLPPRRKRIIQLYFFENKSTPEIAKILNINTQTALNHKTRALGKLSEILSAFYNRAASL